MPGPHCFRVVGRALVEDEVDQPLGVLGRHRDQERNEVRRALRSRTMCETLWVAELAVPKMLCRPAPQFPEVARGAHPRRDAEKDGNSNSVI